MGSEHEGCCGLLELTLFLEHYHVEDSIFPDRGRNHRGRNVCDGRRNQGADKKAAEEKQAKLIETLKSDAPPQDKAIACKQLAVYGGKEAVPALAALLPDEQLSSWARIALEVIPDPAADEALRESIGKVKGRLLVGVINSLGVRRDAKSVTALIGRLKDGDAEVASAAAVALGRIGGEPAAKALEQSLAGAPPAVRGRGCRGLHPLRGKTPGGGTIGGSRQVVRRGPQGRRAQAAVHRGDPRSDPRPRRAAGIPLLVEQLQSADKGLFALGLGVAREIPGAPGDRYSLDRVGPGDPATAGRC